MYRYRSLFPGAEKMPQLVYEGVLVVLGHPGAAPLARVPQRVHAVHLGIWLVNSSNLGIGNQSESRFLKLN